jgi:hypothetical protein
MATSTICCWFPPVGAMTTQRTEPQAIDMVPAPALRSTERPVGTAAWVAERRHMNSFRNELTRSGAGPEGWDDTTRPGLKSDTAAVGLRRCK